MKIRIGDYWGKRYDWVRHMANYMRFCIRENIKFANPLQCSEVISNRMYEHYLDFLPKRNGLMVDVGPQYSDWSIIAAKKYGSNIISFEASRRNFEIGVKNISLNKMEKRITPHYLALGNRMGNIESHYDGGMVNTIGNGEPETIPMTRLDAFAFIQKPDLIKIDIEGYELEALHGMREVLLQYKPRIIIETHTSLLKEQCSSYLYSLGYELKHENKGRKGNGSFDWVQETFWIEGIISQGGRKK